MSLKKIDRKVSRLVATINSYPGIETVMSCGGHKKPDVGRSQVPKDQFYIEFKFTTQPPTREAWASFQNITRLIDGNACYDWYIEPDKWVKIEVGQLNEHSEVLFRMYGHNVDPNELSKSAKHEISR